MAIDTVDDIEISYHPTYQPTDPRFIREVDRAIGRGLYVMHENRPTVDGNKTVAGASYGGLPEYLASKISLFKPRKRHDNADVEFIEEPEIDLTGLSEVLDIQFHDELEGEHDITDAEEVMIEILQTVRDVFSGADSIEITDIAPPDATSRPKADELGIIFDEEPWEDLTNLRDDVARRLGVPVESIPTDNLENFVKWYTLLIKKVGDREEFNIALTALTSKESDRRLVSIAEGGAIRQQGADCVLASFALASALLTNKNPYDLEDDYEAKLAIIQKFRSPGEANPTYNSPSQIVSKFEGTDDPRLALGADFDLRFTWGNAFQALQRGDGVICISLDNDHMVTIVGYEVRNGIVYFKLANTLPGYFSNFNNQNDFPILELSEQALYAKYDQGVDDPTVSPTNRRRAVLVTKKKSLLDEIQIS